jgi:hypothetical protein
MPDDFQACIDEYRSRMARLRETFDRQGYTLAVRIRDPYLLRAPDPQPRAARRLRGQVPWWN